MIFFDRSSRIVELLYDHQGLQCKQCGVRFADTPLGKKNQDDHLDMHFRQNRKANENIDRGHSRSWFVGLDVRVSFLVNRSQIFNVFDRIGYKKFRAMARAMCLLMVPALGLQKLMWLLRLLNGKPHCERNTLLFLLAMRLSLYRAPFVRRLSSQNSWKTTKSGYGKMQPRRTIRYIISIWLVHFSYF